MAGPDAGRSQNSGWWRVNSVRRRALPGVTARDGEMTRFNELPVPESTGPQRRRAGLRAIGTGPHRKPLRLAPVTIGGGREHGTRGSHDPTDDRNPYASAFCKSLRPMGVFQPSSVHPILPT